MENKYTGRFSYVENRIWSKVSWTLSDLSRSRRKLPRFKWTMKW